MEIVVIILSIILAGALAAIVFVMSRHIKLKSEIASLRERENNALERIRLTEVSANERIAHIEKTSADIVARTENSAKERIAQIEAAANQRIKETEQRASEQIKEVQDTSAKEFERMMTESEKHFKLIANEVLTNSSERLQKQSHQQLNEVLNPLKENIESFRKKVEDTYNNEARERFSLQQSLREMMDLNRSIGKEAKELTEALRGNNKVQGNWGEMVLETILEKSGLKRDVHFHVQLTTDSSGNTLRDAQGHGLRPDVVVDFPDGRCVVIDSKVSLTAYVSMINADDPAEADQYARQHINSVKNHIKELACKNYQDYVGDKSTDFVMMFIPNEGAYLAAMNLDPTLWQTAYDQRVIIISPTHLISAVRLIEQLWRQEDMKRNVIRIATESGKMYDKFVGFVEDLSKIGRSLETTQNAYDSALKKLRNGTGNLITRAENLRKMGAKVTKRLPMAATDEAEESDTEDSKPLSENL